MASDLGDLAGSDDDFNRFRAGLNKLGWSMDGWEPHQVKNASGKHIACLMERKYIVLGSNLTDNEKENIEGLASRSKYIVEPPAFQEASLRKLFAQGL